MKSSSFRFVALLAFTCTHFACQTEKDESPLAEPTTTNSGVQMPPEDIESMISEVAKDFSAEDNDKKSEIPLEINERVNYWIRFFTGNDRVRFQTYLNRGQIFRPEIEKILSEHSIPTQLYYLAMIESGFSTQARSRAQAVGIWQFIKPTAQRYNMRVDYWVDERRDPERSTIAAAQYLRDLNTVFQSWYLSMAAYNAGEARIVGAIMRSNTRNFWELASKHALPRETMHYVPKFIAANIIGRHPEKFGFRVEELKYIPTQTKVNVPPRIRLSDMAGISGTNITALRTLNPALVHGMTPPDVKSYPINVLQPQADKLSQLDIQLAHYQIPMSRLPRARVSKTEVTMAAARSKSSGKKRLMVNQAQYRVRSGDNLEKIARKFGTSVGTLKKLNNLQANRIFIGQLLHLFPRRS